MAPLRRNSHAREKKSTDVKVKSPCTPQFAVGVAFGAFAYPNITCTDVCPAHRTLQNSSTRTSNIMQSRDLNGQCPPPSNMWILQSFHYAREMCQEGHINCKVEYVDTRYNISDLFTKGVSKETFQALEGFLLGREPPSKLFEVISKQMEQGNEST